MVIFSFQPQLLFQCVNSLSHPFSATETQDAHKATELEEVMEKQKMKVDLKLESSLL